MQCSLFDTNLAFVVKYVDVQIWSQFIRCIVVIQYNTIQ